MSDASARRALPRMGERSENVAWRAEQVAMLFKGTERYGIGTIAKIFALKQPAIHFLAAREGYLTSWLRERGIHVEMFPGPAHLSLTGRLRLDAVSAFRQARRTARQLDGWLAARGVRLVHTHWYAQQLIAGFLRRRGYHSVWQINSYVNRGTLYRVRLEMHRRIARWGADLLLPASDFVGEDWSGSGVPQSTVHNAALPQDLRAPSTEPPPLRCLAVGRLTPVKGLHVAIEAVVRARDAGAEVELDVYGGPVENNPYADSLRRLIGESRHELAIRLRGFDEALREKHGDYHCAIQCRLDPEPCSLWVCEALADGLPVLASASGGTPELVDDERTGLLFTPGDVEELTAHILSLVREPDRLRRMRELTLTEARPYFAAERFIRQTFDAYATWLPK